MDIYNCVIDIPCMRAVGGSGRGIYHTKGADRLSLIHILGVQGLAADMAVIRMIEESPGQGMAYGFHMDPYLVGPPCFQPEAD